MDTTSSKEVIQLTRGFSLQPLDAWILILGFAGVTALLCFVGPGKPLNFIFPAGSAAVGFYLCSRHPILYLGFTWWVILLAPLVRRMADYQSSFTDPSPILLAPYFATLVGVIALCKRLPRVLHRDDGVAYALALAGIIYASFTGYINRSPTVAIISALDYLCPILFSLYIFASWRLYPAVYKNLERVMIWGVLVVGGYALYQYFGLPPWDQKWVDNASINSLVVNATDTTRIWGTLNSPEPFGTFMSISLLMLFLASSSLRFVALPVGHLSLLVALVRSSWVGWAGGILALITSVKPKLQVRLLIIILIMSFVVTFLALQEEFSEPILSRLDSFSNVQDDGSFRARRGTFEQAIGVALTSFVGQGLGGSTFDNTFLSILINMGWFGGGPYMVGIILLTASLFRGNGIQDDPFIAVARAVVFSGLVRVPINVVFTETNGFFFWAFLGAGLAAKKYFLSSRQQ